MAAKELTWHKLADDEALLAFSEAGLLEIEAAGKKICLAKRDENLYAFSAACPHAGGRMVNGYTDAMGNIVCPTHRYKFNLQNGRNTSGEGYYLKTYPLERRADGLFIGFERSNLLNWLK